MMETKKIKNIFTEGRIDPAFISDSIAKHATKTSIGGLGRIKSMARKWRRSNTPAM